MPRLVIRDGSNDMDRYVAYGGFIQELRDARRNGAAVQQLVELSLTQAQSGDNVFQCNVTPAPNYQIEGVGVLGNPGYNYSGNPVDYSVSYNPWFRVQGTDSASWIHDRETKLSVIAMISEAARNELIEKLMEYSLVHQCNIPMRDILNLSRNYANTLEHLGMHLGATITLDSIRQNRAAISGITGADLGVLFGIIDN